jgi:hypothetical protein
MDPERRAELLQVAKREIHPGKWCMQVVGLGDFANHQIARPDGTSINSSDIVEKLNCGPYVLKAVAGFYATDFATPGDREVQRIILENTFRGYMQLPLVPETPRQLEL